jgi:diketogulonate reductase-like aldo/keto reductase
MASKIPTIKMHNGVEIPIIGLGTATNLEAPNVNELKAAFNAAIEVGYRAFDTAAAYQNESIMGEFFESKFKEGLAYTFAPRKRRIIIEIIVGEVTN